MKQQCIAYWNCSTWIPASGPATPESARKGAAGKLGAVRVGCRKGNGLPMVNMEPLAAATLVVAAESLW